MTLAIVDLGYGNIGSIRIAFERLGVEPLVTSDPVEISAADRVVVPGVGAAGYAMRRIDALALRALLTSLTQPVLGICLGMQMMFAHSDEDSTPCLGVFEGRVRKLDPRVGRPVPHMGWSKVAVGDGGAGLRDGDYLYFAHSFVCPHGPASIATADYGEPIPAAVRRGNYLGAQFHPERSGPAGARFLESFLSQ